MIDGPGLLRRLQNWEAGRSTQLLAVGSRPQLEYSILHLHSIGGNYQDWTLFAAAANSNG